MRAGRMAIAIAILGMASMAPAATILLGLGNGTGADPFLRTWNSASLTSGTAASGPMSLVWTDGTASGVTYSVAAAPGATVVGTTAWVGLNGNGVNPPAGSPAALRGYTNNTGQSLYGTNASGWQGVIDTDVLITFAGLAPSSAYNLYFYAVRGGATDNRSADYTVTGATAYAPAVLDAASTTGNVASVLAAVTDATGKFKVDVTTDVANNNAAGFCYLGVVEIVAVPEPASLSMLGLGALTLLKRRRA